MTKKIDINFRKTCSCPDSHINCLTPKDWVRGQVAVWELYYEKRDIRDKDIHPAVFPIALPKRCMELFTHKGELVLDPFVGIGTTLVAARDLERNAVGFDLNKKYIDLANKRFNQAQLDFGENTKQITICDDAINIPKYFDERTVSLCVTSPPYANMLNHKRLNKSLRSDLRMNKHYEKIQQYSNNPRDLGTMMLKEYIKEMGYVKTHRTGNTGIGKTLEDLLGITENNVPGPNAAMVELKSVRKNVSSMLTLFTKSPRRTLRLLRNLALRVI